MTTIPLGPITESMGEYQRLGRNRRRPASGQWSVVGVTPHTDSFALVCHVASDPKEEAKNIPPSQVWMRVACSHRAGSLVLG